VGSFWPEYPAWFGEGESKSQLLNHELIIYLVFLERKHSTENVFVQISSTEHFHKETATLNPAVPKCHTGTCQITRDEGKSCHLQGNTLQQVSFLNISYCIS